MNIARGTMTLVMLEPTRLTTYSEKPIPPSIEPKPNANIRIRNTGA